MAGSFATNQRLPRLLPETALRRFVILARIRSMIHFLGSEPDRSEELYQPSGMKLPAFGKAR
jgi:hypothetical protein